MCFEESLRVCGGAAAASGWVGFGGDREKTMETNHSSYMRVISSHFPRYAVASLRQVSVSSLTPVLCGKMKGGREPSWKRRVAHTTGRSSAHSCGNGALYFAPLKT